MSARPFSIKNIRPSSLDTQSFNRFSQSSSDFVDLPPRNSTNSIVTTTKPEVPENEAPSLGLSSFPIEQTSNSVSTSPQFLSSSSARDGLIELTKNSKYCVLKLPATPVVLKNAEEEDYLTGSTDQHTYFSLILSKNGAYVWNYTSSDQLPQCYYFPVSSDSTSDLLGTLVSPIAGVKEPGLVTIVPETGIITYWESVGGAIANELLQKKKSIIHQIKLHGSEKIERFESVEPAGIIAATSVGRFILVTYRDSTGKPTLHSETMRGSGGGFLATLKGAVSLSSSRRNVVSIKPGKAIGRDERHAIVITSSGNLMIWDCFRTGQAHILLEENLRDVLLNTFSSLYPHSNATFTVHDVEYHTELEYIYILASFVNNPETSEIYYLLFTVSTEQNFTQIISTHRFRTFTSVSTCRPRLLLPKPSKTLFVLFSQAVILIDPVQDNLHELENVNRWEDIVTFLSGVEAFGFGKEDLVEHNKKIVRYPGIIALTKEAGILRIERYTDTDDKQLSSEQQQQQTIDENSLLSDDLGLDLAKTRIEQAIFYSHRNQDINPVNFEIRKELHFNQDVLDDAFSQVSSEIVGSTSPYLPPLLPSLGDHLELRWEALNHMGDYLQQNFPNELSISCRLSLLWDLEKLYAAKSLWSEYNKKLSTFQSISAATDKNHNSNVLSEIISETSNLKKGDKVRNWFNRDVKNIVNLLFQAAKYSKTVQTNDLSTLREINGIILVSIPGSAYNIRKTFSSKYFDLTEDSYCSLEPWTATKEVLSVFENQYEQTVKVLESIVSSDQQYSILSSQLISIVATLCEIFTERIKWLKFLQTDSSQRESTKLAQDYKMKQGGWIRNLAKFGHKQEAQIISEQYRIYRSLAEILGEDYRTEVKKAGDMDSVQSLGIIFKLQEYIANFGYDFASVLFQYYVETQQLKSLLKQFPQYNDYLERFLESGNYGRFSWIHDLLVGNNSKAASTLLNVSIESEGLNKNKRLQLSIAKLSALASGETDTNNGVLYERINSQLAVVDIQDAIYNQIELNINKSSNGSQATVYTDNIDEFLNSHNMNHLKSVLRRTLNRIVNKQTLKTEELVDVLTLMGGSDSNDARLNFFRAMKLIYLPTANLTESQIKFNLQLIWRRLYLRDE